MEEISKLVVFELSGQRFALDIASVEQIVRIVEINSLPEMPEYIAGVINFHGEIIPVLDMHFLFNRNHKEIELSDQLIIVKSSSLKCALWVDRANKVIDINVDDTQSTGDIMDGVPYLKGIVKDNEGMVFISDIDKFIKSTELQLIDKVLNERIELVGINM